MRCAAARLLPPRTQGGGEVPGALQAHAWIALGKVCMVDEGLAKKCVPLFVQVGGRAAVLLLVLGW